MGHNKVMGLCRLDMIIIIYYILIHTSNIHIAPDFIGRNACVLLKYDGRLIIQSLILHILSIINKNIFSFIRLTF